jgi:4'-phosphopantetheinyl transferase EntD
MSAVIFSDMYQVGIDVESLKRPYAPETTAYFMSPPERNLYYETPQRERPFIYFLTWCAKEALYKLFSPWASLSFRDHIILLPATLTSRTIQAKALLRNRVFLLNIEYFQRNDFLICYVFSVLHPDYID